MTVDEAVNVAVIHTLSIKHGIAVSEAAEAASILAAEVRRLRDEVNGLTGSLDRAEKALKEAQEQEPVAWLCGKDVTTHKEYAEWFMRFTQEDCTQLYARPVPAVPAVAVPAVPKEWLEFVRCVADNYDCDSDAHRYGTPCRSCDARAILQSTGDQK